MVENIDESAAGMLRNFGREAEGQATRMAQRCASRGDGQGEQLWIAIASRISQLRPHASDP